MKEYISSKNNEQIKIIRKLAEKKYRKEFGLYVVEGHKLIYEYLRAGNYPDKIFATEAALDKYCDLIAGVDESKICVIPYELYQHISTEQAPQGILALCKAPTAVSTLKKGNVAVLESIRDAGNLGTIIRTAGALGIDNILMSSDCADLYNPKTIRATMGALFYANIVIAEDIVCAVEQLKNKGRRIFAAMPTQSAVDVRRIRFEDTDCVVIGNEGNGITKELAAVCDRDITIPMIEGAESLNASVAAAILMWELVRGQGNA